MIVGAVDIGGTKIAVGLVNESGELIAKKVMQTAAAQGVLYSIERISQSFRSMTQQQNVVIDGIGIACTGPVDSLTGELSPNSFLPGWEGRGLIQGLAGEFHLPLAMENDADAAALAESRWGAGKGCQNFLYLTVSTGIGSGLILNGHLYRGVDGAHPEMGHQTIDPSGPKCFCGSHGCWEILASGPAMQKWYGSQISVSSSFNEPLDTRQICELARKGDPTAILAVEHEAYYLGLGLANLITLFTPNRIALGGGVMKSWDLFESRVRQIIQSNCGLVPFEKTKIAFASLGPDVNLLGAGQAWFHRYHSN
jgi:glucokinase